MSAADATAAPPRPDSDDGLDPQAGATKRPLSGEKAQRIIDAMRHSVAKRGTTGSTFDHVSREAGVSRGLLHYYFGTKEQLLVEAVRRDGELRIERLQSQLATAKTADDFIGLMAQNLQETSRGTGLPDARLRAVHPLPPQRGHRRRVRRADPPHARAGRRNARLPRSGRACCDLHAESAGDRRDPVLARRRLRAADAERARP